MATFTTVGDKVELTMRDKGDVADIDISGTYNMTIELQRERGAPGSGAYEMIKKYTTANATVGETYVTEDFNERLRLIATAVTSGSATVTLADNTKKDHPYREIRDQTGKLLMTFSQAGAKLYDEDNNVILEINKDNLIPKGGIAGLAPVAVTGATLTVTRAAHAGRVIALDRAAGIAVTLPDATGSGDTYTFYVKTTFSGDAAIKVSRAADTFVEGSLALLAQDAADTAVVFSAAATDDTLDLFDTGNTTGGMVGAIATFIDVAPNKWLVRYSSDAAGIEATPFKNTVS